MTLSFSSLVRRWADAPRTSLAEALVRARAERFDFLDLVNANPHEHGLVFPEVLLREALAEAASTPGVRMYAPDALGHPPAREAIAAFYRRRGVAAVPDRILLTPGTSQAYLYALRLLTEPGDDILVPAPGYPLFDDIAALCGVRLRRYHLRRREHREPSSPSNAPPNAPPLPSANAPRLPAVSPPPPPLAGWRVDPEEIEFQCTPRTRAIMVVSPHNPTGLVCRREDFEALGALCRRRGVALVHDEVFSECVDGSADGRLPRPDPREFPLLLVLNGFSKMLSLPGWKVGWMRIDGADSEVVGRFLQAVEHLSDVFLPVPELIQAMVEPILRRSDPEVIAALAREWACRREVALGSSRRVALERPEAGVYLVGRLPAAEAEDDEAFCLRALLDHRVLVHPGYLYDLPPGHVVFTCASRPAVLREGLARLDAAIEARPGH